MELPTIGFLKYTGLGEYITSFMSNYFNIKMHPIFDILDWVGVFLFAATFALCLNYLLNPTAILKILKFLSKPFKHLFSFIRQYKKSFISLTITALAIFGLYNFQFSEFVIKDSNNQIVYTSNLGVGQYQNNGYNLNMENKLPAGNYTAEVMAITLKDVIKDNLLK